MAQALKRVMPAAKLTIGPPLADSYYYDFDVPEPFTPEAARPDRGRDGRRSWPRGRRSARAELPRDEAIASCSARSARTTRSRSSGELPPDESDLRSTEQGEFIDLCRGPHVPNTGRQGVQAAQRGGRVLARRRAEPACCSASTAPRSRTRRRSNEYLHLLEEAKKRDHRKLGKELDLFSFHDERARASRSSTRRARSSTTQHGGLLREELDRRGYVEICTPHHPQRGAVAPQRPLGPLQGEHVLHADRRARFRRQAHELPGRLLVYRSQPHSYRDLPLRWPSSAWSTATNCPACCTACSACAASRRTTRTSSARPTRSRTRSRGASIWSATSIASFGFDDVPHRTLARGPRRASARDEMWENGRRRRCARRSKAGHRVPAQPGRRRVLRPEDRLPRQGLRSSVRGSAARSR